MTICSFCKEEKNIIWKDYVYASNSKPRMDAVNINLCFECAKFTGMVDISKIMNCNTCGQLFVPKKASQVKCGSCWRKYFLAREKCN